MNTTPIKKQAGRPPKALKRKIEERKGFLKKPFLSNAIFELLHDNPDMFKSIFDACKKVNDTVNFIINNQGMIIYFETKTRGCFAMINIFGNKVVGYFCENPIYISCDCDKVLKILKSKKKDQEKIKWAILNNDLRSMKIILLSSDGMNETWSFPIETTENKDLKYYTDLYDKIEEYPLKFTIKWAKFKGLIDNWKSFTTKDILFEKDSESPLYIKFEENQITDCAHFDNEANIDLHFNSKELVSINVPILHLTPIASADSLSGLLTFHIKEGSELILTAKIDEIFSEKKKPVIGTESAIIKYFIQMNQFF